MCKLTDEDVSAIRQQWRPGVKGLVKAMKSRYGVSGQTIWRIATGRQRT